MRRLIVFLVALSAVTTAEAQNVAPPPPAPSSGLPAYITLPWGIGIANPAGQVLRKVWVPARTVVLDTYLPEPDAPKSEALAAGETTTAPESDAAPSAAASPQYMVWRQTSVVPGFWVHETTAGVYYPQRWEMEQTAPGTYRWRLLPAEMRAR
jgi:hypothetical protein